MQFLKNYQIYYNKKSIFYISETYDMCFQEFNIFSTCITYKEIYYSMILPQKPITEYIITLVIQYVYTKILSVNNLFILSTYILNVKIYNLLFVVIYF